MQAARHDEQRRVPGAAGRQSGLAFFLVTFSWRNKKKSLAGQRRKAAVTTEKNPSSNPKTRPPPKNQYVRKPNISPKTNKRQTASPSDLSLIPPKRPLVLLTFPFSRDSPSTPCSGSRIWFHPRGLCLGRGWFRLAWCGGRCRCGRRIRRGGGFRPWRPTGF